ncbi:UDP-N-acetylmuramoyl-tripeptide--D-alanyl-D-alanine ligase [Marinomonas pollencensis]|uniref:UDP-N-acetylmuramoyl-tripeptide--D-alanyl-D-alanine ligase n=1 Tax=Marinomonas pollencensis TaxID=491954 RepID=A0A3E0DG41_9GAMM|nr:UDP-N-acetylmuramoyl-tripeptide--D-alanyl-D-alanine ligase [Marinomonas pollencensis]REG81641.1 UDP-N-acetylmuramoyl-tripeptide--D-alanyl-D-alanine ligase [Marinomonas pollencensis]
MLLKLSLSQIAALCNGELIGEDGVVNAVVTDTRTIQSGCLFVAIKGERFDGHDYAQSAIEQGAVAVLSQQDLCLGPYIKVADTVAAYGRIARAIRDQFSGPVVAITGSNGKTTVKDWLAQSLSEQNVLKTRANLNNQIGVPQTLLGITAAHDVAVIEAGTSFPGEIKKLADIIAADVVILTNASGSHFEGFGSLEGIAVEKGGLISAAKADASIILNADDGYFDYWKTLADQRRVCSFGFTDTADLCAKDVVLGAESSRAVFVYQGQSEAVYIAGAGRHLIANGMAVVLALMALGMSLTEAVAKLAVPVQVPGRMERLQTKNKALLINDCYNASPTSVEAAIDVLAMQKVKKTWLILGALGELGEQQDEIHRGLGEYAQQRGISCLISVGPLAGLAAQAFRDLGGDAVFCQTHKEAASVVQALNDTHAILVKGSRSSKMENVVNILTL